VLNAAHPKELPLKALIELLEEREENCPCHAVEAHPEVLPGTLSFKEMEEDVDRRGVPKMVHSIEKALMKAQLLGCSWAGTTLISVNNALRTR